MGEKSKLTRSFKYRFIHKELVKLYGGDTASRIAALAEKHYADCEKLCRNGSKGERQHLDSTILPTVSIYKALLEIDPDNALTAAHTVMMNICQAGGAFMQGVLKLPGMKSAFMWFLPKMAVRMFGPSCGFRFENFAAHKNLLKMDMTACPYCRYAEAFGCPELTSVFCDSDLATYGNLPGIRFRRSQTLGTGGSCCDFQFIRE